MIQHRYFRTAIVAAVASVFGAAQLVPGADSPGPVSAAAAAVLTGEIRGPASENTSSAVSSSVSTALEAFEDAVRPLSHSRALSDAFRSYFAYKAAHPEQVKKPYLYFVDYGLPSTAARGYVFDMDSLKIVDGPFTVAHGRGSSSTRARVPTRFSNVPGSATTSLGLYVAQETYGFNGKAGGRHYTSVGLRLMGVSGAYNDKARARRVVAHGAPYVTPSGAGRSEGCPAMEQSRAKRLLPALANGGMVFLFAPDNNWLNGDPWIRATAG